MKKAPHGSSTAGSGNNSTSNTSRPIAGKKTFPRKPITPDRKNPVTPGDPAPKTPQEISTAHYKHVTMKTMQSIADTLNTILSVTKLTAEAALKEANPLITLTPEQQKAIQIASGEPMLPHMPVPGEETYTITQYAAKMKIKLNRALTVKLGKEGIMWARCLDRSIPTDVHKSRPTSIHRESLLKELFKYHKSMIDKVYKL